MSQTMSQVAGTRSTMGTQAYSNRKSSPSFGFGSSNREQNSKVYISPEHATKANVPKTPGPGSYAHSVSTGRQPNSTRESKPAYGFGSQERFGSKRFNNGTPGPGSYVI